MLHRIEVRPIILPVMRISHHPDHFVRLKLDELKWPSTDRMIPHVAKRDVAGVDR